MKNLRKRRADLRQRDLRLASAISGDTTPHGHEFSDRLIPSIQDQKEPSGKKPKWVQKQTFSIKMEARWPRRANAANLSATN